jgi:hypothetical protein
VVGTGVLVLFGAGSVVASDLWQAAHLRPLHTGWIQRGAGERADHEDCRRDSKGQVAPFRVSSADRRDQQRTERTT